MASRGRTAAAPKAEMPALARTRPDTATEAGETVLVFRVGEESLGFRLDDIAEIVRPGALARMPLAPPALMGLANLRGVVLPVIGLRQVLRLPPADMESAARIIVVNRGTPVGFAVDRVDGIHVFASDRINRDTAAGGAVDPALLDGVVLATDTIATTKILNPGKIELGSFGAVGGNRPAVDTPAPGVQSAARNTAADHAVSMVSFDIGAQEYALPLDAVREIIPLSGTVAEVSRAEGAVVGVMTLRDRLLPLISLRALLGLSGEQTAGPARKVLVVSIAGAPVGLIADRAREVLRVHRDTVDPAPPLLARGSGDAEIVSICRLENGRRLVAVLSPDRLFSPDLVRRLHADSRLRGDVERTAIGKIDMADEQFIVFRVGSQEFGLPIAAVHEIARPPEKPTKLPKAPAFLEGVMNLRGEIVPLIDLRKRFGVAATGDAATEHVLVLLVDGHKTGFVVDIVSEVLAASPDRLQRAPETSPGEPRLIERVLNLEADGRIILMIDPAQLIDRVESGLISSLGKHIAGSVPAS